MAMCPPPDLYYPMRPRPIYSGRHGRNDPYYETEIPPRPKLEPPKPAFDSYYQYVSSNVSNFPEYGSLGEYLHQSVNDTAMTTVYFVEFSEKSVNVRTFYGADVQGTLQAIDAKPEGVSLRIILVSHATNTGISHSLIEKLGHAYDIDPSFFIDHLELLKSDEYNKSYFYEETGPTLVTPTLRSEERNGNFTVKGPNGQKVSAVISHNVTDDDDLISWNSFEMGLEEDELQTVVMLVRDDCAPLKAQRRGNTKPSIYRETKSGHTGHSQGSSLTQTYISGLRSSDTAEIEGYKEQPSQLVHIMNRILTLECSAKLEVHRAAFAEHGYSEDLLPTLEKLEDVLNTFTPGVPSLYAMPWDMPRRPPPPPPLPQGPCDEWGNPPMLPPQPIKPRRRYRANRRGYDQDVGDLLRSLQQLQTRVKDAEYCYSVKKQIASADSVASAIKSLTLLASVFFPLLLAASIFGMDVKEWGFLSDKPTLWEAGYLAAGLLTATLMFGSALCTVRSVGAYARSLGCADLFKKRKSAPGRVYVHVSDEKVPSYSDV